MQNLIVYIIVALAAVYAAWLFMPQAARRWLVARLVLAAPPSQRARFARLQADAESVGCSTCKGCETDTKADAVVKPIRLHRH
jgi:hypothetical protein